MQVACENCHTSSAWKLIRSKPEFDHGKTGYPLRGMHAGVACQECHVNLVFAEQLPGLPCRPPSTEKRGAVRFVPPGQWMAGLDSFHQ
jgi:hypothetical protein